MQGRKWWREYREMQEAIDDYPFKYFGRDIGEEDGVVYIYRP